MSIASIWGSFGSCFQSVVKACDCSSSEVNSASVSGPPQSTSPICSLTPPTFYPLTAANVRSHSVNGVDASSKVEKWLGSQK